MVFSKSDRTKYHHFPMLFFPMNINYKKWWHKAVVFTGNGGTKRWFYSKVVEQSATTLYLAGVLGEGERMADKIHCIRKTLRLMPQEAEMLAKKAGESGMCEADYLRLLISQKPNDYPEVRELLKELINEVNRIGININQIVFNNNAGLYSKEDKTQLVAYMRKLNKKVNEAVVQIGNQ